jgi:YVTN family beta-propeller protein
VIDTATNKVMATVPVGAIAVAVSPDGKHVYVAGSPESGGNISVIDTATNTVEAATITLATPNGIAFTPDRKHAYVTDFLSNAVWVIDTTTTPPSSWRGAAWGVFPVVGSLSPRMGNTSMSRIRAAPATGAPSVVVIDTASNTGVAVATGSNFPGGVAITRMGNTSMSRILLPTTFS